MSAPARIFGTGNSLANHAKIRMSRDFENSECHNRTIKDRQKIKDGLKLPRDHVGPTSSYKINDEGLMSEVLLWNKDSIVDFEKVGRKFLKGKMARMTLRTQDR